MNRGRHIRVSGLRCITPALSDQPFCFYHAPQGRNPAALNTAASPPPDAPGLRPRNKVTPRARSPQKEKERLIRR